MGVHTPERSRGSRGRPWGSFSQEAFWEKVSFLGIEGGGGVWLVGLGAESGRQMAGSLRMCGWEMGIGDRMAAANRFS